MRSLWCSRLAWILLLLVFGMTVRSAGPDSQADAPPATDIDTFMEKVLVQRQTNWEALHNYVFREKEVLEFRGGLDIPALQSFRREYVWIVRDGLLVRNPVVVNGVTLSPEEQRAEESRYKPSPTGREVSLGGVPDRESFLTFKFERGNYFFAGRREFRGRPVVVVEYYPERLFSGDDGGDEYENMLDKTTLVTMLIDPAEYQIVNVTFDNVGLDFLPGRWLVRVEKLWATMTLGQPVENEWLPEGIRLEARVTTAMGDMTAYYERSFYEYRQTDVKVKFYAGEVLEEKDEK
ncbi:MAG: hypothetical protein JXQ27_07600 [Acidobacteria bacterium]|nr:hypothetical protein [Acidobacteriota bacterium]